MVEITRQEDHDGAGMLIDRAVSVMASSMLFKAGLMQMRLNAEAIPRSAQEDVGPIQFTCEVDTQLGLVNVDILLTGTRNVAQAQELLLQTRQREVAMLAAQRPSADVICLPGPKQDPAA